MMEEVREEETPQRQRARRDGLSIFHVAMTSMCMQGPRLQDAFTAELVVLHDDHDEAYIALSLQREALFPIAVPHTPVYRILTE